MSSEALSREHRLERLRALTQVSRALTYTTSIAEVLRLAVHRAADLMGADRALIMLSGEDNLLRVQAAYGVDETLVEQFREPLNETLNRRLQALLGFPSDECFLSVPLVVQGQVIGLLAAVRPTGAPCTDDDEWLLSALADQAAVALENARLSEAVRDEREERSRTLAAQDRLHATLSHELRSPLTAVQAYSALLLEGLFGELNDRQRESVARIQLSGRHLLSIIENVLEMARLHERMLSLAGGPVVVAQVLMEAGEMLQPSAADKRHQVHIDAPASLIAHADADHLRQVVLNLLGNAIKYTPPEGAITASAALVPRDGTRMVAITITDTGCGIAPETLPRIFEPYVRGGSIGYEPGLGLGLFISRELIRRMGGEIEVQSTPGSGSRFTVFLPRSEAA